MIVNVFGGALPGEARLRGAPARTAGSEADGADIPVPLRFDMVWHRFGLGLTWFGLGLTWFGLGLAWFGLGLYMLWGVKYYIYIYIYI